MDYANESYVRCYTRDTTTWKLLTWQARAVLQFMLRKVDRAGVLEVGDDGVDGLAAIIEVPVDVVEPAIEVLVRRGVVIANPGAYILPNFIEAQEAVKSDRLRARDARDKRRALMMSKTGVASAKPEIVPPPSRDDDLRDAGVTPRDATVTGNEDRHETSRGVTLRFTDQGSAVLPSAGLSGSVTAADRSRNSDAELLQLCWETVRFARDRAAKRCPAQGVPLSAMPGGPLATDLLARLRECRTAGEDDVAFRGRVVQAVAVAEAKAVRDQNLRHFATAFEPGDWKRAMDSNPDELRTSRPSSMAQGAAATTRAAASRTCGEKRPPKPEAR
jgi:hypothetical protein